MSKHDSFFTCKSIAVGTVWNRLELFSRKCLPSGSFFLKRSQLYKESLIEKLFL